MEKETEEANPNEPSADKSYQIGYRKPPKATRFKPGQSGNPRGRKKKTENVADQVTRILAKRITVTERGVEKRLTLQEFMLTTLANKAAKGDLKALAFILDLTKSHERQTGSEINPELLEADSKEIIGAFLRQQSVGQHMPTDESKIPFSPIPEEPSLEDAKTNSYPLRGDAISMRSIEGAIDDDQS